MGDCMPRSRLRTPPARGWCQRRASLPYLLDFWQQHGWRSFLTLPILLDDTLCMEYTSRRAMLLARGRSWSVVALDIPAPKRHCQAGCHYAIVPTHDEDSQKMLACWKGDIIWPPTCMQLWSRLSRQYARSLRHCCASWSRFLL